MPISSVKSVSQETLFSSRVVGIYILSFFATCGDRSRCRAHLLPVARSKLSTVTLTQSSLRSFQLRNRFIFTLSSFIFSA